MTPNLLVYIFFAIFFIFLAESIYFLKKKLSVGIVEITNPENQQKSSKFILIGGLLVVLLTVIVSFIFFFPKQQTSPSTADQTIIIPTKVSTQILPSPTPDQVVYNLPITTPVLSSPTPIAISKISPTKVVILTRTPIPTKTPTPTKLPKSTPTVRVSITPTSPSNSPPIGGPQTIIPTVTTTPTTALVIVPKLPVAGSVQQTLIILLVAISSIAAGFIL